MFANHYMMHHHVPLNLFLPIDSFLILNISVDITVRNILEKLLSVEFSFICQGIWRHGNSIGVGEACQAILQECHCSANTVIQTLHQKAGLEKLHHISSDH